MLPSDRSFEQVLFPKPWNLPIVEKSIAVNTYAQTGSQNVL